METDIKDNKQSKFNMGISYLERLDYIQQRMNFFSIIADYKAWYRTIKTLYRELYPVMKEDEINEFKSIIAKCEIKQISNYDQQVIKYKESYLEDADILLRSVISKNGWIDPKERDNFEPEEEW